MDDIEMENRIVWSHLNKRITYLLMRKLVKIGYFTRSQLVRDQTKASAG